MSNKLVESLATYSSQKWLMKPFTFPLRILHYTEPRSNKEIKAKPASGLCPKI
jgi:hypothetical protein